MASFESLSLPGSDWIRWAKRQIMINSRAEHLTASSRGEGGRSVSFPINPATLDDERHKAETETISKPPKQAFVKLVRATPSEGRPGIKKPRCIFFMSEIRKEPVTLSSIPFELLINIAGHITEPWARRPNTATYIKCRDTRIVFAFTCKRFTVAVFKAYPLAMDWKFPERRGFGENWLRGRRTFLLSLPIADWMALDMQYCHTCDKYKVTRDAGFAGRKIGERSSGLRQCGDCYRLAGLHSNCWDTKICSSVMCTRLNNERIVDGEAKRLCDHGFIGEDFDQRRAWDECEDSCPGWLRMVSVAMAEVDPVAYEDGMPALEAESDSGDEA